MIFDTLENLNQYTGLFEHLDTAIAFLQENDVYNLPMGRTEIDGDNVYITVSDTALEKSEERPFEVHSRYMDLQMDLEGTEICEVALGEVDIIREYNEAGDAMLCNSATSAALVMGEGRFAIFMVEEAHKPNVMTQDCAKVKKAVMKILY